MQIASASRVRWVLRASFALADQAFASLLTFVVNVLLARWLTPLDYGAFAIAFAVFLLANAVHAGSIVDPVMVFGASRYSDSFRGYVQQVVKAHFLLTGVLCAALLIVAGVLALIGSSLIAQTLAALAIATPVLLLPWLMRRAYYVIHRTHIATLAAGLQFVLSVAALAFAARGHLLRPGLAFLILGLAGLPSSVFLIVLLRRLGPGSVAPPLGDVVRGHWTYARWGSAAMLINWVPANGALLALAILGNVAGAASIRSLLNLIQPPALFQQAVAAAALPAVVRRRDDRTASRQFVGRIMILFIAIAALFWLGTAVFARPIVELIYAGRYTEAASLLPVLALVPLCLAITGAATVVLQSTERPKAIAVGWLAAAMASATVGFALTAVDAVRGAAWGMVLTYVVGAIALARPAVEMLAVKRGAAR